MACGHRLLGFTTPEGVNREQSPPERTQLQFCCLLSCDITQIAPNIEEHPRWVFLMTSGPFLEGFYSLRHQMGMYESPLRSSGHTTCVRGERLEGLRWRSLGLLRWPGRKADAFPRWL